MEQDDDDDEDSGNASSSSDELPAHVENQPCPVLEFRIANRLFTVSGGEIIDASVSVVASIDAAQACQTVRAATGHRRKKGKRGGRRTQGGSIRQRQQLKRSSSGLRQEPTSFDALAVQTDRERTLFESTGLTTVRNQTAQAFEEDPTGHLVPKRIISKLECQTHDHPFFKRVFFLRHTLDETSPLLRSHARELVRRNRGFWPAELNNAEGVRNAIHFDQLLISLTGTSNADANSVYAQTVYDFDDVHVGYRFVNMLYRNGEDGELRVDLSLINDVMEQAGGGGEPLHTGRGNRAVDMDVL